MSLRRDKQIAMLHRIKADSEIVVECCVCLTLRVFNKKNAARHTQPYMCKSCSLKHRRKEDPMRL